MSIFTRISASLKGFSFRTDNPKQESRQINVDIYAKVFVSTSLEREALTELLCGLSETAARDRFFDIITDEISLSVDNNDSYDPMKTEFLHFKYFLEVNPFVDIDESRFLHALAKLEAFLKRQGFPVVTACDDEDQLARLVEKELAE